MSRTDFAGDVLLRERQGEGEIFLNDGLVEDCGGLDTAIYLSLFGGNDDDTDGRGRKSWWGNFFKNAPEEEKIVSRFQAAAKGLAVNGANLKKLEGAAAADLKWLKENGLADKIDCEAFGENPHRVKLNVRVMKENSAVFAEKYYYEWGAKNGVHE